MLQNVVNGNPVLSSGLHAHIFAVVFCQPKMCIRDSFTDVLDQLFAQFGDMISKLEALLEIDLDYPINAMTRVCKKLSLPKKAAVEAISMFEMAYGGGPATAHDVFLAMQEIPFILKTQNLSLIHIC